MVEKKPQGETKIQENLQKHGGLESQSEKPGESQMEQQKQPQQEQQKQPQGEGGKEKEGKLEIHRKKESKSEESESQTSLDEFLEPTIDNLFRLTPFRAATSRGWTPDVDVCETKNCYKIFSDLPGLSKEEINVEIDAHGKLLMISGERKKESQEEEGEQFHFFERNMGKFSRRFKLPRNADLNNTHANLSNGVLILSIGKIPSEQIKSKKINIS